MKNHSRHLHAPICVIFVPNSGYIARYAPFIWRKSPANWDAHLPESIFQTRSGVDFRDVPDVYILYLSEHDFLKGNRTIYHVESAVRETGKYVDDGLKRVFVNTQIDDKTDIAGLMKCFLQTEVDTPRFPELSRAMGYFKKEREGVKLMCAVVDDLINMAKEEAEEKAREEAEARKREVEARKRAETELAILKEKLKAQGITI